MLLIIVNTRLPVKFSVSISQNMCHLPFSFLLLDSKPSSVMISTPPPPPPPHLPWFLLCRTSIGIRCKDGVVFGVEKLITSKLHEVKSNKRIFTVDHNIGVVSLCCFICISYVTLHYINLINPLYNYFDACGYPN